MTLETALQLKKNVVEIIASASELLTLTPRTTLTADTTIGGTTLSIVPIAYVGGDLDGQSKIRTGMRGRFYDDLGERTMSVADVSTDGATVTLATSARAGFTGLTAVHPAGTVFYSNIVATRGPFALGPSIEAGEPLVAVTVTEGLFGGGIDDTGMNVFPTYQIHVQTSRMLYRPGQGVDTELWNDQQEDLTIADIERIKRVLLDHEELITEFSPGAALQFGELGSGKKVRTTHGPREIDSTGTSFHYIGVAQVVVTATGEPIG